MQPRKTRHRKVQFYREKCSSRRKALYGRFVSQNSYFRLRNPLQTAGDGDGGPAAKQDNERMNATMKR